MRSGGKRAVCLLDMLEMRLPLLNEDRLPRHLRAELQKKAKIRIFARQTAFKSNSAAKRDRFSLRLNSNTDLRRSHCTSRLSAVSQTSPLFFFFFLLKCVASLFRNLALRFGRCPRFYTSSRRWRVDVFSVRGKKQQMYIKLHFRAVYASRWKLSQTSDSIIHRWSRVTAEFCWS